MKIENYLKEVPLFRAFTEEEFGFMCQAAEVIRFPKEAVIINEGDVAECCYYIISGSVQVFTIDRHKNRIVLARLDENDYFGEQAYLNNLIRTASVKAHTDVELIRISYNTLDRVFKRSDEFRKYLEHVSLKKYLANLQALPSSINEYLRGIFTALQPADLLAPDRPEKQPSFSLSAWIKKWFSWRRSGVPKAIVRHFKANEIIFNKGDTFDYVYLIASGSVSIELGEEQADHMVILGKNTIFGERGILEDKPRAATARSMTNSALVAITGEDFLKAVRRYRGLNSLTIALRNTYLLPKNQGMVSQYRGQFKNQEAIFTSYNLPQGQKVTCSKVVNQPIFTMQREGVEPDITCTFTYGKLIERTVMLKDMEIVGFSSVGEWDELNYLCQMLLENVKLHFFSKEEFLKSGSILNLSSNSDYLKNDMICNCMHMTYEMIKDKISEGFYELEALSAETGVCTACGACRNKILDILNKSSWTYAVIQLKKQYNEEVCEFIIKPLYGRLISFLPGQFISIKIQIDGHWIERSYTLVSYSRNVSHYEIIVKKFQEGILTPWLFKHKEETLLGWISQPMGNFVLKEESQKTILCFSGGIGITPFIAFIHTIQYEHTNHKLHLFYAVDRHENVILPQDVKSYLATSNMISLELWDASIKGFIDEVKVNQILREVDPQYIYVCGSARFKSSILSSLEKSNFDQERIFWEEFVPAG